MAYVEYEADGKTIKARVWQKVDTLANWEANSLVIGPGEQAFVIDGAGTPINFKIGDGTKKFSELPWWISYDQGQYVQVVGNALPTPTVELGYSFVGPGTYTHAGGNVVAPDGRFSQIVFQGGTWSLKDMGALPIQEGTDVLDPQGEGIPKEKATAEYVDSKTIPLGHGKNFFNPANIVLDKYIGNTGVIQDAAGWAFSGFIDITSIPVGQNITLSSDRNRKGVALFDSTKTTGRYIDVVNGTFQRQTGEDYIAFNLYSIEHNAYTWAQLESGSVATTYEPYKKVVPTDSVEGLTGAITNSNTALSKSTANETKLEPITVTKSSSKNILNPAKKLPDSLLNNNTGEWVTSAFYNGLDYTPVLPNTLYRALRSNNLSFSIRGVVFKDINGAYLSTIGTAMTSFTTPSNAYYVAASILKTEGEDFSQMGLFLTGDSFEPYAEYKDVNLTNQKVTSQKSNENIATISDVKNLMSEVGADLQYSIDGSGNLQITEGDGNYVGGQIANNRLYSGNNMFNFMATSFKGVTVGSNDDVAPMHILGSTLGANHGYPHYIATIASHGLTNTAIGSEFVKDGVKFYPVRIVDVNRVAFLSENAGTDTNFIFTPLTVGTISLGATNYSITAVTESQLYPSLGVKRLEVFADKMKVGVSSSGYAEKVSVVEEYDIYNTSNVLTRLKARAGQAQDPDFTGDTVATVKNGYVFRGDSNCVVTVEVLFKQAVPFVDIMANQAVKLSGSSAYYIPNSNPLNGSVDLRKPTVIAWSSSIPNTFVTNASQPEPTNPPNRVIQYSGNLGFMIGYLPGYNDLSKTARTFEIRNNTGKIYPHPIEGTKVGTTTSVNGFHSIKLYRAYTDLTKTRTGGRLSYFVVHEDDASYIFLDYSATMFDNASINIPELNGKVLEVVESKNAVLLSKTFNQGFVVNTTYVEGQTCYMVVKVK